MSPFDFARIMGQKQTKSLIWGYLDRRQKSDDLGQKEAMADYIYHLCMRKSTSDCALMIMFNQGLQAYLPLGTVDKLCNPDLPIPVSFIMGDNDWVRYLDEDYGQICVDSRHENKREDIPAHLKGQYVFCPSSGHNMHMDNPVEFSNLLINMCLG